MHTHSALSFSYFTTNLLLSAASLNAVTTTWNVTTSPYGRWDLGTNWDTGDAPTSSDNVFIANGGTVLIDAATTAAASQVNVRGAGFTNTLNITGGSLTITGQFNIGSAGTGILNQSGGTATFGSTGVLGANTSGIGSYNLSGGTLTAKNVTLANNGKGTITQTGGSATIATLNLVQTLGASSSNSSEGLYEISGGTLHLTGSLVNGNFANTTSAGAGIATFRVIGSTSTINVDGGYVSGANQTSPVRTTILDVRIDNGGLSKINLTGTGTVTLAGTLSAGFKGGVAFTTTDHFSVIEANTGKISGTFTTSPNSALWNVAAIQAVSGTRDAVVLSYAVDANKGTLTAASGVTNLDFSSTATGFVALSGLVEGSGNSIYLKANAGSGQTISSLISYFTSNGIVATASDLGAYDLRLSFTAGATSSYFAWDLNDFNAGATLSGLGLTSAVPEPSSYALLLGAASLFGVAACRRSKLSLR